MTFSDNSIPTITALQLRDKVYPKKFAQIASQVVETIQDCEFGIIKANWVVTGNNQILLGSIDINPKSMQGPALKSFGYFTLSLRVSSNTKYALSFLSGARVDLMESPGYFCPGEEFEKRRATSNLCLEDACEQALHKFTTFCDNAQLMLTCLKNKKVTTDQGFLVVTRAQRLQLIPYRSGEQVINTWFDMTVPTSGTASAWDLMQCFDSAWHKLGPVDRFEFFKAIYPLFSREFDLPRIAA